MSIHLQLVVQDGIKHIGAVSSIISKASKMVYFVRHLAKLLLSLKVVVNFKRIMTQDE